MALKKRAIYIKKKMINVKNIKINIPPYPRLIIDKLMENGYEAYIVGGCVRDEILGKKPDDYDVTTNAKPKDIKKIFKKTIDTGIKHGTVSVLFYEKGKPIIYEVTTFRVDGDYIDGRHPKEVRFVGNLKDDLYRRDFTINAMAYNDSKGLIDIFDGIKDLDKKVVRAVGNPIERFTEDGLRLLRAIRFSAKLGFDIEKNTENAIKEIGYRLENVSKERVLVELTKTITSKNPMFVKKIFDLNLSKYICEGFSNLRIGKIEPNLSVYMAYSCLLYNTEINEVINILKRLKLDNNNISKIKSLLEAKEIYGKIYKSRNNHIDYMMAIKELINFLKYDLVYDFIELISINENSKTRIIINDIKEKIKTLQHEKCPIFIKDLDIDGNDIMTVGYSGQEVGIVLNSILKIVHKNRTYNDKNILMDIIKKIYKNLRGTI